jgi:hypothetical protein
VVDDVVGVVVDGELSATVVVGSAVGGPEVVGVRPVGPEPGWSPLEEPPGLLVGVTNPWAAPVGPTIVCRTSVDDRDGPPDPSCAPDEAASLWSVDEADLT